MSRRLVLSTFDERRLRGLLQMLRGRASVDVVAMSALEGALASADVVAPERLPRNVITMNSRVRLLDLDNGERVTAALVFPGAPRGDGMTVPVLSPLGVALLGAREGETLRWETPAAARRLLVEQLLYQPEAEGDYQL